MNGMDGQLQWILREQNGLSWDGQERRGALPEGSQQSREKHNDFIHVQLDGQNLGASDLSQEDTQVELMGTGRGCQERIAPACPLLCISSGYEKRMPSPAPR